MEWHCDHCGWHQEQATHVYADAFRGYKRRVAKCWLETSTLLDLGLCIWCFSRGFPLVDPPSCFECGTSDPDGYCTKCAVLNTGRVAS